MVVKKIEINEALSNKQQSQFDTLEKRIDRAIKQAKKEKEIKVGIPNKLDSLVLSEIIRIYEEAGWDIKRKYNGREYETWLELV